MQEFFVAATRKLGVDSLVAKGVLKTFAAFEVVQVSPALIHEAIDCSILNRLSFWDALILAAAASAACTTVLSEDLNPVSHPRRNDSESVCVISAGILMP